MEFVDIADYRSFIRRYLQRRPSKGRGEIARLADAIGVHPTFVSQVLTHKKDFNLEQTMAVAEFLSLTEVERKFLLLLVQKERAGTPALKSHFKSELQSLKSSLLKISNRLATHTNLSETDKAIFYSSWIYSAVRLFCSEQHGKTLEDITTYFQIGRQRAIYILDFLCEKSLCVKNKNLYTLGTQHTHIPSDSPFVIRHHMNWRTKALHLHETMVEQELAFTAPMSISAKDFDAIREKILTCIQDSIEIAKASPAEDIAFLNIDWLWAIPRKR